MNNRNPDDILNANIDTRKLTGDNGEEITDPNAKHSAIEHMSTSDNQQLVSGRKAALTKGRYI
jgi:hypothetical protein